MRALLALAFVPFALSGCIGAEGSLAGALSAAPQDCSTAADHEAAQTADVLLPAEVPADRPKVTVEVREGQLLTASATWQPTGGQAQAVFDGPTQHAVETEGTWASVTMAAPAGVYTLSLEGAPLAVGVSYTLSLVAVGCTPA